MTPHLQVTSVTLGCPDPVALAQFYAHLLDTTVTSQEPGWAQLTAPRPLDAQGRGGVTLNFEREAQWTTPVWPAEAGRQFASQHLDIWVDDLDASVAWALDCGATLAAEQPQDTVRVMIDPAGHPFCLFA
ncbi:VOC family protein [Aestuariimicrobium soli]|uniref:VOC family protein n=1 Tax=Aestuariimicrobium soli TaxID=2035834 RepID=UPI003EBA4A51